MTLFGFSWSELFSLVVRILIAAVWASILLVAFTIASQPSGQNRKLYNGMRMILTWVFIMPIFMIAGTLMTVFALIAHLCVPIFPWHTRLSIAQFFSARFWSVALFFFEFWPGTRHYIRFEGNVRPAVLRDGNQIILVNHAESPFDWMAGLTFCDFLGRVNRVVGFMKRAMGFVPVLGWMMWLGGNITLKRSWKKDAPKLKAYMPIVAQQYPRPWIFGIYPEGTRQNPKKLAEAKAFARERGYAVLENLLQPRVKGFKLLVNELRGSITHVLDLTTVYLPKAPSLKYFTFTGRLHLQTNLYVRVYDVKDLPTDEKEIDDWLRNEWAKKDKIIDDIKANKIEFTALPRDPKMPTFHYSAFVLLCAYALSYAVSTVAVIVWMITALFPALIVFVENDDIKGLDAKQRKYAKKHQRPAVSDEANRDESKSEDNVSSVEQSAELANAITSGIPNLSAPLQDTGFDIVSENEDSDNDEPL